MKNKFELAIKIFVGLIVLNYIFDNIDEYKRSKYIDDLNSKWDSYTLLETVTLKATCKEPNVNLSFNYEGNIELYDTGNNEATWLGLLYLSNEDHYERLDSILSSKDPWIKQYNPVDDISMLDYPLKDFMNSSKFRFTGIGSKWNDRENDIKEYYEVHCVARIIQRVNCYSKANRCI